MTNYGSADRRWGDAKTFRGRVDWLLSPIWRRKGSEERRVTGAARKRDLLWSGIHGLISALMMMMARRISTSTPMSIGSIFPQGIPAFFP